MILFNPLYHISRPSIIKQPWSWHKMERGAGICIDKNPAFLGICTYVIRNNIYVARIRYIQVYLDEFVVDLKKITNDAEMQ